MKHLPLLFTIIFMPTLHADSIVIPTEVKKEAALISGLREDGICRYFLLVSSEGTVNRNFSSLGNNLEAQSYSGCLTEVALFSKSHGALLRKNVDRWTDSDDDNLFFNPPEKIEIPTVVWIVHGNKFFPLSRFATEKIDVQNDISFANNVFEDSKCGMKIRVDQYYDRTDALPDPEIAIGCGMIETTLKTLVGYEPNRMNIYVVNELKSDVRAGVACKAESDNVIIVAKDSRPKSIILHEFGHWLSLNHTTSEATPEVNADNIMSYDDNSKNNMLTAGQCYRANFDERSYVNLKGLRQGPIKRCRQKQDNDENCPGLKKEF